MHYLITCPYPATEARSADITRALPNREIDKSPSRQQQLRRPTGAVATMVAPTHLLTASFLYAIGNTPAVNLTGPVPPDQDAHVLLLGCGDVRNVLFSVYMGAGKGALSATDLGRKNLMRSDRSQNRFYVL